MGAFLTVIDLNSLNVALPSIGEEFNAGLPSVQWAVLANALTITALLLPMGRLSDVVGRREVYVVGFTIVVLGAIVGGTAASLNILILARVLQGVGAAMIQANMMSIPLAVFPADERGKVMGLIMSTVGVGGVVGPPFAGLIVGAFGWRSVFFATAILGLAAIIIALAVLEKRRPIEVGKSVQEKFDWMGAVLSAAALLLFLLIVSNGYRTGWFATPILIGIVAFIGASAGFVWWELRIPNPMFELRLFRRKLLTLACVAAWISFLGTASLLFIMPFYLQQVLGYSPTKVGLVLAPLFLCLAIISPLSGRLSDRFGWRAFTVIGLAISIAAMVTLSRSLTITSSLMLIIPVLMLRFTGHALFNAPNSNSIFSAVETSSYSVVSALTQVLRNSGSVAGIAIMTMVIVTTMDALGVEPSLGAVVDGGGEAVAEAFVIGARRAFMVLSGLFAVGLLCSLYLGRPLEDKG